MEITQLIKQTVFFGIILTVAVMGAYVNPSSDNPPFITGFTIDQKILVVGDTAIFDGNSSTNPGNGTRRIWKLYVSLYITL